MEQTIFMYIDKTGIDPAAEIENEEDQDELEIVVQYNYYHETVYDTPFGSVYATVKRAENVDVFLNNTKLMVLPNYIKEIVDRTIESEGFYYGDE